MKLTENELLQLISKKNTAPFLFIGSGFSRRYLGTPDWLKLLDDVAPYHINKYITQSESGKCQEAASLIAKDLLSEFWNLPESDDFFIKHRDACTYPCYIIRQKIKDKLSSFTLSRPSEDSILEEELTLLQSIVIDGIITTNWDLLLEELFPKFKVFIGQSGLLYSQTQGLAEIYKIHGCITDPKSLVLTQDDYDNFNRQNAFLAAKLLILFAEHPVIFLGYSFSDENIQKIITDLANCYDVKYLNKLSDNLIFVEWNPNPLHETSYSQQIIKLENGNNIPISKIETHSYSIIFKALNKFERKIPTHNLARLMEMMATIVISPNPEKRLVAADWTLFDNGDLKDIDFVANFGITEGSSDAGYLQHKIKDIIQDVLFDNRGFKASKIIDTIKNTPGITPMYKYLSMFPEAKRSEYTKEKAKNYKYRVTPKYLRTLYAKTKDKNYKLANTESLKNILAMHDLCHKLQVLVFYKYKDETDLDLIQDFLKEQFENIPFDTQSNLTVSIYRKCVAIWDYYKYSDSKVKAR